MDSLLNFQDDCATRILKAYKNYRKSPKERITKEYVESRLDTLEQLWSEFLKGHKELMKIADPIQYNASSYVVKEVFDVTQETYTDYKCELKTVIGRFNALVVKAGQSNPSVDMPSLRIRLPEINIPVFSGQYTEWTTFRDLFVSMIHNNEFLDKVQKLHYLKGYLTGEAEQLLRNIPISEANYDLCWKQLESRYNNKNYLSHCIIKRLLGQKTATTESASFLKELIDTTTDCLSALSNLGVKTDSWDVLIVHILSLKLDSESRKQWELNITSNTSSDELPTFAQFKEFVTNRFRALEFLEPNKIGHKTQHSHGNVSSSNRPRVFHVANSLKCPFCAGEHKLHKCQKFCNEDSDTRRNFVQETGLCFICLGRNHLAKFCQNTNKCRICKRYHHSLLHPQSDIKGSPKASNSSGVTSDDDAAENTSELVLSVNTAGVGKGKDSPKASNSAVGTSDDNAVKGTSELVLSVNTAGVGRQSVVLATALVNAETKNGKTHTIRALLDQGSQASFINEATVQLLRCKKISARGKICGLGGEAKVVSSSIVYLTIRSIVEPAVEISIKAHVLKSITSQLPSRRVREMKLNLQEIKLADPQYHNPNKIDMLLGAEVYGQILREGILKDPSSSLVAQSTSLGWIISGLAEMSDPVPANIVVMHSSMEENDFLKKFWEIESETSSAKTILTEEEQRCEELFMNTTRRDLEGRYIVKLPFKNEKPACVEGQSRHVALRRFLTLEKKLLKNKILKQEYEKTFEEYLHLKHMEPVKIGDKKANDSVYLPYHEVVREDKDTTKVRIVFDASCKGTNGVSLNDDLMVGPRLQMELRHIIMRWRTYPIALVADIIKMYRQIKVLEDDTNFQRILWRANPDHDLTDYKMLRVTFGTSSAPYLAVKCLMQVALDEGDTYPIAAEKVLKDFYMDDLMTGCQSVEEGIRVYNEINELLSKAGFQMQKWSSNSNELLEMIREENKDEELKKGLKIKIDSVIKILGLTWHRSDDSFNYTVVLPEMLEPVTKRKIISDISRLYDPLRWVAPSIILAKIMIQKLWLAGIDWDEAVPKELLEEWLSYRHELTLLSNMKIPRWLGLKENDALVELHGFSDASKVAYAAVVYVRCVDSENNVKVNLLTAKTKVAPVKQVSVPRLELCGAVLLANLLAEVSGVMGIDKENIYAWTDSTVVLAWMNSHPSRWKTFVANRVSKILDTLDPQQWSHIPSKQNPADCASRGLRPSELLALRLWVTGPATLSKQTVEFNKPKNITTDLEEVVVHFNRTEEFIWDRFSSLTKLIRVVAYCKRWLNLKKLMLDRNHKKPLTSEEIDEALETCIKRCQDIYFELEIRALKEGKNLRKNCGLVSLNPYLDEKNILRVGGRLELSQLGFSKKHPIVIPKHGNLTILMIDHAHKQTLHGGPQLMLSYLYTKYWIVGAKQLVKAHVRKCVVCVKRAAHTKNQLMGQLPAARVTPSRPFKHSGVDFAGPINVRTSKGRGYHAYKGYICLFICMSTRAVHLEVVSDLTSQGFLAAFKRFVARRGHCTELWSDNGTNFVGASRELKTMFNIEKSSLVKEIAENLATNQTTWHFIPPHAPNFGGLWEAAVKSTKYHLKRVIGESTLTYEELSTVLSQVEACLNSRPLSRIDATSDEFMILTPSHFLIGEPLVTVPDRNFETSTISSLRRWQLTQRMLQDFWRRWSHEYLVQLQHRYKWIHQNPEPSVGDIVLIKEDDLPPCRWLLGKVVTKHPGADNITRVVTLRTKYSLIKRPTSKLCILPIAE